MNKKLLELIDSFSADWKKSKRENHEQATRQLNILRDEATHGAKAPLTSDEAQMLELARRLRDRRYSGDLGNSPTVEAIFARHIIKTYGDRK